jgi:stage II sporulation protein D
VNLNQIFLPKISFKIGCIACCLLIIHCAERTACIPASSSHTTTSHQHAVPEKKHKVTLRLDSKPATSTVTIQNRAADIAAAPTYDVFPIPRNYIRIALKRNVTEATVSSAHSLNVAFNTTVFEAGQTLTIVQTTSPGIVTITGSSGVPFGCALPCTLIADSPEAGIRYAGTPYRGKLVLESEKRGCFSVINYADVEDYLCGVVPLEIGIGRPEDIEAAKAQAVAARTYTYKRMLANNNKVFDMLPTVADQVYGGMKAENAVCCRAVMATAYAVMLYGDSLITAYYYSTCGGTTANIENVWLKSAQPYLQSVDDHNDSGMAYCAASRYYTWREAWTIEQLSEIVRKNSKTVFPGNPASGTIESIDILSRFSCGRVASCRIKTSVGSYVYGGDNLRFVFKRPHGEPPILRSSNISDIRIDGDSVIMTGIGYGHGVGMCQCGALGRARAGQTFEQILKAYYTGVELRTVSAE